MGIRLGRSSKIDKYGVPVRVQFADGSEKHGLVFVRNEQRILDLLCDARPFFPMRTKDSLALVSKANVSLIEVVKREDFETRQDLFPPLDWDPLEDRTW